MAPLCWVVGMLESGWDSLAPSARQRLMDAQVVIGHPRLISLVQDQLAVPCLALDRQPAQVMARVAEALAAGQRVAVLASGDPLFHGLGNLLVQRFGVDQVGVETQLSTQQIALARLGLSLDGVARLSVHRGDGGPWHPAAGPDHPLAPLARGLGRFSRMVLLTSPANDPRRIAHMILELGLAGAFHLSVCERLCSADETITRDLSAEEVVARVWQDPNVVVLVRTSPLATLPLCGQHESRFHQADGRSLVTRREVRAAALAQMALTGQELVWDIGAGSGSVALEAARLCPDGWVWAVEKKREAVDLMEANRRQLGVFHLTLVHAKAPASLDTLPDPDVVFVGGSCGNLEVILAIAWARLRPAGRLVLNFVTLENLAVAMTTLNRLGAPWEAVQIHASRHKLIKGMNRLEGAAPVWILTSIKASS